MTDTGNPERQTPELPDSDPPCTQYFMCDILYVVDDTGAYVCSRDWVEVEP
jgi:hypothetical protein